MPMYLFIVNSIMEKKTKTIFYQHNQKTPAQACMCVCPYIEEQDMHVASIVRTFIGCSCLWSVIFVGPVLGKETNYLQ